MRPENGLDSPTSAATLQEAALRQLIQTGTATNFEVRSLGGGLVIGADMGRDGNRFPCLGTTHSRSRILASATTIALPQQRLRLDHVAANAPRMTTVRACAAHADCAAAARTVVSPKGFNKGT